MASDVTHIYKGRYHKPSTLPSAWYCRNSLRVVWRKCSEEQMYKYLLWVNIEHQRRAPLWAVAWVGGMPFQKRQKIDRRVILERLT